MESSAEVKVLHRLVHSVAGLAGTLGFFSLCTHAQKLELQLAEILQDEKTPDTARWPEISRLQNQLEKLALFRLKSNAPSLMPFVTPSLAKTSPLIDIADDDENQARDPSTSFLARLWIKIHG